MNGFFFYYDWKTRKTDYGTDHLQTQASASGGGGGDSFGSPHTTSLLVVAVHLFVRLHGK